jgi:Ran-binding protein 9/10
MTNGAGTGNAPPASYPSGPSGGLMPRRSSYASVLTGQASQNYASPARAGAFSHLVNTTPSSSYPPQYTPDYRYQRHLPGQDSETNANGLNAWRKSNQIPHYSRKFAHILGNTMPNHMASSSFFVPSYLRNSRYVSKLETAHKAKLAAQREATSTHSSNPASLSTSSSNVNLHRMAPSHRGMTYDIIESNPPGEDDNLVSLPSRWNDMDKYPGLDLLQDGLEIRYNGPSNKAELEAAAARADHPMSPQCGIYYFEVEIKSKSKDGMIAVGFSSHKASLERLPGWEAESWAYHGDDGKSFFGEGTGKVYGPTFGVHDVVGCGLNFATGCAFWTKNGRDLGIAFRELKNIKPFPAVGMKKSAGSWVSVNFGQKPFIFDIDGMMTRERLRVEKEIDATPISTLKLNPPIDESTLVQELVAHFLAHDGYVGTAKAFAEEVKAQSRPLQSVKGEALDDVEAEQDHDAINRQSKCYSGFRSRALADSFAEIRAAILEGDIDKAFKHTTAYYPHVLEDNPEIVFRLKCRKYVEMIKRCSDLHNPPPPSPPPHPAHDSFPAKSATNGHTEVFEEDMELDEDNDNDSFQTDTASNENTQPEVEVEAEAEADERKAAPIDPAKYDELLQEAMAYGQTLMREYRDEKREYRKTLEDIFSLIAYDDAKASVHGHLLETGGRVQVAEELNSAILGK